MREIIVHDLSFIWPPGHYEREKAVLEAGSHSPGYKELIFTSEALTPGGFRQVVGIKKLSMDGTFLSPQLSKMDLCLTVYPCLEDAFLSFAVPTDRAENLFRAIESMLHLRFDLIFCETELTGTLGSDEDTVKEAAPVERQTLLFG